MGRYTTRDPIGYGDGLNVYLYVHNNPINHIDPLGLQAEEEDDFQALLDQLPVIKPGEGVDLSAQLKGKRIGRQSVEPRTPLALMGHPETGQLMKRVPALDPEGGYMQMGGRYVYTDKLVPATEDDFKYLAFDAYVQFTEQKGVQDFDEAMGEFFVGSPLPALEDAAHVAWGKLQGKGGVAYASAVGGRALTTAAIYAGLKAGATVFNKVARKLRTKPSLPPLPGLDPSGKVHGPLPRPEDLGEYTVDDLRQLHRELKQSVQQRIRRTIELGPDKAHGQRQGAEQQLIKSIEKVLENHGNR